MKIIVIPIDHNLLTLITLCTFSFVILPILFWCTMVLNVIKSERQIKAYEVGVGGDIKEKKEREKHKRRM